MIIFKFFDFNFMLKPKPKRKKPRQNKKNQNKTNQKNIKRFYYLIYHRN
jgi:hypothetical protein